MNFWAVVILGRYDCEELLTESFNCVHPMCKFVRIWEPICLSKRMRVGKDFSLKKGGSNKLTDFNISAA